MTVAMPKQALLQHKREICWYTEHSYFTPCRTRRSNLKFVTRVLTKKNEKKKKTSWFPAGTRPEDIEHITLFGDEPCLPGRAETILKDAIHGDAWTPTTNRDARD